MEESSTTALYTGAFVMVFVSSLTLALFLFNNILNLSEIAYDYNLKVADNQTIVNVPAGTELLLSSDEVASYYYNYVKHDVYEEGKPTEEYNVTIYCSTQTAENKKLSNGLNLNYYNLMSQLGNDKKYILKYDSVSSDGKKVNIVIRQATDDEINSMY